MIGIDTMTLSTLDRTFDGNAAAGDHTVRPDTLPLQSIELSQEELKCGTLSPDNKKLASVLLSCRGYVILKNALPLDYVAKIRQELDEVYMDCRATQNAAESGTDADSAFQVQESTTKKAAFWYRRSRWRVFPKLTPPLNDPRLLANPFVTPVLDELLGSDFYCKYVSSDICVKGAILQSPHSDIDTDDLFIGNRWRPRGYVVNVPVMECGLYNGPLEIWPGGSHMWSSDLLRKYGLEPNIQDGRNPDVERVAEYFPSTKVVLHPGEILIRDLTMWHRGTPNPTDEPRSMLTIAYFRRNRQFGYGDASYNLDQTLFEALAPTVQKMFAYHFNLTSSMRRQLKQIRRTVRGRLTGRRG